MRICIYGAGAMGTSLGALLTRGGVPCELVSRNARHVAALKRSGAQLFGEADERIGVEALLPEEMTGEYDLVILAVKQRDNGAAAEFLKGYLKTDGALLTVQNGLPEGLLAQYFGKDRVLGCTLSWGAELTEAGCVRITSANGFHLAVGTYGDGKRLDEVAKILERAGSVTVGDLHEIRFAKLAVNAAFSSLSALSGLTFGEIVEGYRKYALKLMKEVFAVARAAGCRQLPLNGHDLFRVFRGPFAGALLPVAMKNYRDTRSGMLKDLKAGRRCEIDYISGAAAAAGRERGVKTPYLERVTQLVHDAENGLAEIAPESIALLDD